MNPFELLRNKIGEGDIDVAIIEIERMEVTDEVRDEVIMLKSSLHELEHNNTVGILTIESYNIQKNNIKYRCLKLISKLEKSILTEESNYSQEALNILIEAIGYQEEIELVLEKCFQQLHVMLEALSIDRELFKMVSNISVDDLSQAIGEKEEDGSDLQTSEAKEKLTSVFKEIISLKEDYQNKTNKLKQLIEEHPHLLFTLAKDKNQKEAKFQFIKEKSNRYISLYAEIQKSRNTGIEALIALIGLGLATKLKKLKALEYVYDENGFGIFGYNYLGFDEDGIDPLGDNVLSYELENVKGFYDDVQIYSDNVDFEGEALNEAEGNNDFMEEGELPESNDTFEDISGDSSISGDDFEGFNFWDFFLED